MLANQGFVNDILDLIGLLELVTSRLYLYRKSYKSNFLLDSNKIIKTNDQLMQRSIIYYQRI